MVVQQDSTLILTASGKKFASDAQDWKWWHPSVPGVLRKLYLEDGFVTPLYFACYVADSEASYRVVVISNQAGIALRADSKSKAPKANHTTKLASFKAKVSSVFQSAGYPYKHLCCDRERYLSKA